MLYLMRCLKRRGKSVDGKWSGTFLNSAGWIHTRELDECSPAEILDHIADEIAAGENVSVTRKPPAGSDRALNSRPGGIRNICKSVELIQQIPEDSTDEAFMIDHQSNSGHMRIVPLFDVIFHKSSG